MFSALVIGTFLAVFAQDALTLTSQEELGKKIFFDTNLSTPVGQSCAVCHVQNVDGQGLVRRSMTPGKSMRVQKWAASSTASPHHPLMLAKIMHFYDKENWVDDMFWDVHAVTLSKQPDISCPSCTPASLVTCRFWLCSGARRIRNMS